MRETGDVQAAGTALSKLTTPCLLLDRERLQRNAERLRRRASALGVQLRPHVKTAKCVEVARIMGGGEIGPITVSTINEAAYFADHGARDILYAVGVAPAKLDQILSLRAASGADIMVVVDSLDAAQAVSNKARQYNDRISALIEVDCDGHRAGVSPGNRELLLAIGRKLNEGACCKGVMTHAGGSYGFNGRERISEAAEQERAAAVAAADHLRAGGISCPVVSVGSTPTAHRAAGLEGVTELRAGVYAFFDLVMAGLGVCALGDIAISVLATVIGHQTEKDWIVVDAGWAALSRDRGTANQAVDQGYGLVCDAEGALLPDMIVAEVNQEHGIVTQRPGSGARLPLLPIGAQLRILPNHACATAAQHQQYAVLSTEGKPEIQEVWKRISGW